MAIITKFVCDGDYCEEYFRPDDNPYEYGNEELSENGWTKESHYHYCETCSEKRKKIKEESKWI